MSRIQYGRELGPEYQAKCVASWIACGLQPYSVNSTAETSKGLQWSHQVPVIEVKTDASCETKRPLVYFRDLLGTGKAVANGGLLAITNADVMLRTPALVADLCSRVSPTRAVMVRRTDIDTLEQVDGIPFFGGFDLFVIPAAQLAVVDAALVFGAPWWDYFLPISLLAQGIEVELVSGPIAFHLRHDERWDLSLWRSMGERYVAGVQSLLSSDGANPLGVRTQEYKQLLGRILSPPIGASLSAVIEPWPPSVRRMVSVLGVGPEVRIDRMRRLASETVAFFDRSFSSESEAWRQRARST